MRKITLDTNAYSAFMRGDEAVMKELAGSEIIYLPLFVIGELHYGFRGGSRFAQNKDELEKFLSKGPVRELLPTRETAVIYGELQDQLKRAGTPVPINDLWIASVCVETGSRLITYDHHFRMIPGLRCWDVL